eukprot:10767_1
MDKKLIKKNINTIQLSDVDESQTDEKFEINIYPFSTPLESCNTNNISLLSWNIMYKDFIDKNDYPYCNDSQLNWNERLPKITNIIESYNADIICLQEVDKYSFNDDFGNYFQTKYNYLSIVNITKKK